LVRADSDVVAAASAEGIIRPANIEKIRW